MKAVKVVQTLSLATLIATGVFTCTLAAPSVKAQNLITICHGAGQAGTTHYETLTISSNAVYQTHGQGGHFYEDGTPQAGHENDYFGECLNPSASPSVSPSVSPSALPSIEPSASPSIEPSVAPSSEPSAEPTSTPTPVPTATPTSTPTPSGNNSNNNSASNNSGSSDNSGSNTSTSEGQVLGAYAETGVVEDVIMNALGSIGGLMTAVGSVLYGKKKNKNHTR